MISQNLIMCLQNTWIIHFKLVGKHILMLHTGLFYAVSAIHILNFDTRYLASDSQIAWYSTTYKVLKRHILYDAGKGTTEKYWIHELSWANCCKSLPWPVYFHMNKLCIKSLYKQWNTEGYFIGISYHLSHNFKTNAQQILQLDNLTYMYTNF